MSKYDDELEALSGVDIKTERRLIMLIGVCFVGFVLAVHVVAGWLV